jgi:hypothetical protein
MINRTQEGWLCVAQQSAQKILETALTEADIIAGSCEGAGAACERTVRSCMSAPANKVIVSIASTTLREGPGS